MKLKRLARKISKIWSDEFTSRISALNLSSCPTYLDIGSAGGIPVAYRHASKAGKMKLVLVDAQDDWRLTQSSREYAGCSVMFVKAALGEVEKEANLFITSAPACSSLLEPNFQFLENFPVKDWFHVEQSICIKVDSYFNIHNTHFLPQPDIVKIDVQGAELDVLRGFGLILDGVTCVELEVNLERLYKNQPTLSEVYDFMSSKGFALRDLKPQGPFEGLAIEYNSYWSRRGSHSSFLPFWMDVHNIWQGEYFADIKPQSFGRGR